MHASGSVPPDAPNGSRAPFRLPALLKQSYIDCPPLSKGYKLRPPHGFSNCSATELHRVDQMIFCARSPHSGGGRHRPYRGELGRYQCVSATVQQDQGVQRKPSGNSPPPVTEYSSRQRRKETWIYMLADSRPIAYEGSTDIRRRNRLSYLFQMANIRDGARNRRTGSGVLFHGFGGISRRGIPTSPARLLNGSNFA
jgi:hypothetical protein